MLGSTSIWMRGDGNGSCQLRVSLPRKRVPTASSRSLCWYSSIAAASTTKKPTHCGWSSGNEPRPEAVVRTPAPMRSASLRIASEAPAAIVPPPAQINGRFAWRMSAAACSTSRAAGVTGSRRPIGSMAGASIARYCWSMGISTETGPGRPDQAR